jgi:hypothetical protein
VWTNLGDWTYLFHRISPVIEGLAWQTARRDDPLVAQAGHGGEDLEAVFPRGGVGLLDDFDHFLDRRGVLTQLTALELPGVERGFLPIVQFVLLKTLLGSEVAECPAGLALQQWDRDDVAGVQRRPGGKPIDGARRGDAQGPSPARVPQSSLPGPEHQKVHDGATGSLVQWGRAAADRGGRTKGARCVFGWKGLVLIEVRSRLPLAMKVGKMPVGT